MAIVLLSLVPQIHLWLVRGKEWNGAHATLQGDEFLYSAYVNALIDGRPRRNDPFAGRDSTPTSPLPESTFSIQFIPPYVISFLARAFDASTASAFIVLIAVAGFLASLSIYWLLLSVTDDGKLAATGVILVLCLGEMAGDQGMIGVLLLDHKLSVLMPFLRRYQPATVFSFFFFFCTLVWWAVTSESRRNAWMYSVLSGLTAAVLVFSYLYLWTAAAAWLACFAIFWLILRPKERRRGFASFCITGLIIIAAVVPYGFLVVRRSTHLDQAQVLVLTHQPDLLHTPELIGALILLVLALGVVRGTIDRTEPRAILAASFGLLPFVLFNQQVLTGRSVQPFHFDLFVANYVVLVGLIVLASLLWRRIPSRTLAWTAALCLSWGLLEMSLLAVSRNGLNVMDDLTVPVLLRLRELSKHDGTLAGLRDRGIVDAVVFSPHVDVMRLLPTWTSQGTLLGAGTLDFGSASAKERRELLYLHLYYSEVDAARFGDLLNQKTDDLYMNFLAPSVIFGDERFIPSMSLHSKPIQQSEIDDEVRAYQLFADSFSRDNVIRHRLAYLILLADREVKLPHIDQWYERDGGEQVGAYTLYRLKLRD